MNADHDLEAMRRSVRQLAAYTDIAKALTSTLELDVVLDVIGARLSQMLGAERWSLLLMGDDGMLHFSVAKGPGAAALKDEVVVAGEGIAGAVYASGRPRLVVDVRADPDFAPRFDAATSLQTGSAVAVPLLIRGRTLGVLELVNGVGAPAFTRADLDAAAMVADFAAIAIDNARNFALAQELTLTDEHTGAYNARHLRAQVERELARSRRFARPVSLLFLDLDHFKQVNDTRGHLAGSQALKLIAQLLKDNVRTVDFVFRYGGDEFAVLLVESGPDGARLSARRILEALHHAHLDVGGGEPLQLTASIGWASFPDQGQTAAALLDAADAAMYRAKQAGRDRIADP